MKQNRLIAPTVPVARESVMPEVVVDRSPSIESLKVNYEACINGVEDCSNAEATFKIPSQYTMTQPNHKLRICFRWGVLGLSPTIFPISHSPPPSPE